MKRELNNNQKKQQMSFVDNQEELEKTSLIKDAWKRLLRNKLAVIGMVILATYILIAIFAPIIAPYDPVKIHWGEETLPPFWMQGEEEITKVEDKAMEDETQNSINSSTEDVDDNNISKSKTNSDSEEWSSNSNNNSQWSSEESSTESKSNDNGGWSTGSESSTSDEAFGQQESMSETGHTKKGKIDRETSGNKYWLGTDQMGRCLFSRIIFGARFSILIGIVSVSIAMVVGTMLGLTAGFFGGKLDTLIMRTMDILLSFPYILLAIFIVSILGQSLTNAMIAIGIVGIPRFARVVRGQVLSVKEEEYVMASKTLGANSRWIITKHVFVNSLSPLIVQATMFYASSILYAAGLGFLGLGAQPPTPEWGVMLSDARSAMLTAPWIITFPGFAIILLVLGFNMLGDGLRDCLDPRQKR